MSALQRRFFGSVILVISFIQTVQNVPTRSSTGAQLKEVVLGWVFLLLLCCLLWVTLMKTGLQFCSYLTPEDMKHQHHISIVEKELHEHPEKYPDLHLAPKIPDSPVEQEKEVEEFDQKYELPKVPKPHIDPSL